MCLMYNSMCPLIKSVTLRKRESNDTTMFQDDRALRHEQNISFSLVSIVWYVWSFAVKCPWTWSSDTTQKTEYFFQSMKILHLNWFSLICLVINSHCSNRHWGETQRSQLPKIHAPSSEFRVGTGVSSKYDVFRKLWKRDIQEASTQRSSSFVLNFPWMVKFLTLPFSSDRENPIQYYFWTWSMSHDMNQNKSIEKAWEVDHWNILKLHLIGIRTPFNDILCKWSSLFNKPYSVT